jgi:site-specific recombinase XerD
MKERKLSTSSIITNYWSIRTWVEWLHDEEKRDADGKLIISDAKLKKIQKYFPKVPKNENVKTRALSDEEVDYALINIHDPVLNMLFWTGINYGVRAKEYMNLEVESVDLENKILHIFGKGQKHQRIPILDHHIDTWEKWFEFRKQSLKRQHNFVFFSSNGRIEERTFQRYFNHMSALRKPLPEHLSKKYSNLKKRKLSDVEKQELIEIKFKLKQFKKKYWFTSHTLRRTFATNLKRENVDILVISKFMGHRSINTTQIYLRIPEEEIFDAYRNHYNKAKA